MAAHDPLMHQVRAAALSRHSAPNFTITGGLEILQLRKLSWLARCLFQELLALSDHATGRVATSYAVLIALLDFDQTPKAHALDKPTIRRLRTAISELVAHGLVKVDAKRNRAQGGLFFELRPRAWISASNAMSDRMRDRPRKAAKPATARPAATSTPDERQGERQGVQDGDLSPKSPAVHSSGPRELRASLEVVKQRISAQRGGKK